ncbi:hypothetical protein CBM2623_B120063 [Cupriavidus taiwanensis]|nr:hypothetical protein CBM2608_B130062 [Cupriavidus taiwanensis]SPA32129.1 hypothetical protein CBM2623_B120063 [Cupriavidus taiwanensis]
MASYAQLAQIRAETPKCPCAADRL